MLMIYVGVVAFGVFCAIALLAPEMAKPPVSRKANEEPELSDLVNYDEPDERVRKLEVLLAEKNKDLNLLQRELKALHVQLRDFDKIKSLLDDQIHHLKEQNRIFRSELGLPAVSPRENAVV